MKKENFIKCYEALREELGRLCKWNCEIWDMENDKEKKSLIDKEKDTFELAKAHFRGMCDMAKLTGELVSVLSGKCEINSEFGWFFE